MKILTATDAKNRFSELIDMAQVGPVRFQRRSAMLRSCSQFRRLSRLRQRSLVVSWGMGKKHATSRDSKTGQFGGDTASRGGSAHAAGNWQKRDERSGQFTVGSAGMAKLNSIEGITQSRESQKMFAEFERSGASAEERRRTIIAKHARKG